MGGSGEVLQLMDLIHARSIKPVVSMITMDDIIGNMEKLISCNVKGKVVAVMP